MGRSIGQSSASPISCRWCWGSKPRPTLHGKEEGHTILFLSSLVPFQIESPRGQKM